VGSVRDVPRQAAELVETIAHSAGGGDEISQEDEGRISASLSQQTLLQDKKAPTNWAGV